MTALSEQLAAVRRRRERVLYLGMGGQPNITRYLLEHDIPWALEEIDRLQRGLASRQPARAQISEGVRCLDT